MESLSLQGERWAAWSEAPAPQCAKRGREGRSPLQEPGTSKMATAKNRRRSLFKNAKREGVKIIGHGMAWRGEGGTKREDRAMLQPGSLPKNAAAKRSSGSLSPHRQQKEWEHQRQEKKGAILRKSGLKEQGGEYCNF